MAPFINESVRRFQLGSLRCVNKVLQVGTLGSGLATHELGAEGLAPVRPKCARSRLHTLTAKKGSPSGLS